MPPTVSQSINKASVDVANVSTPSSVFLTPPKQRYNSKVLYTEDTLTLRRSPRINKQLLSDAITIEQPNALDVFNNHRTDLCEQDVGRKKTPVSPTSSNKDIPATRSVHCPLKNGAVLLRKTKDLHIMGKVYTYLHSLNKQKLRAVCKRLRCRLGGNKQELLYRSFLFLSQIEEQNEDVVSFMSDRREFEGVQSFLADNELVVLNAKTPPSTDSIIEHLRAAGDKIDLVEELGTAANNESNSEKRDPNFTHSEFARMVLIMRDDEPAKEAMFALSQELERPVLDSGIRRDSFWDVIAARFNNASVRIKFDFGGSIDGVDASIPPSCSRSAAFLKDHYKKAKGEFTKAFVKWNSSGQNDPDRFTLFLSFNKGQLYAQCKRAHIIFLCCRLGTPHANTLLLESFTKNIIEGGLEEGLVEPAQTEAIEVNESSAKEPKRRRKNSGSILEDIQDASRSIIEASSAVTKRFKHNSTKAAGVSTMSVAPDNGALHRLNVKSKCYEELQTAYDNLQSATTRGDPVLIRFAQDSFDEAKKVCEEVGKDK